VTENIAELLVTVVGPFAGAVIGIVLAAIMVLALFQFFFRWFDQEE
jgi:hypothetical protein